MTCPRQAGRTGKIIEYIQHTKEIGMFQVHDSTLLPAHLKGCNFRFSTLLKMSLLSLYLFVFFWCFFIFTSVSHSHTVKDSQGLENGALASTFGWCYRICL